MALLLGTLSLLLVASPASAGPAAAGPGHAARAPWTGTWSATMTTVPASDDTTFEDQTLRQVVRTSIGGDELRVQLSNTFGTEPLVVGEARVARQAPGGAGHRTVPASDRAVRFDGARGVTIPPGESVFSDPVRLSLPEAADLVVSVHLPEPTRGNTVQAFSSEENYVAAGNVTGDSTITPTATSDRWHFLSGISVRSRDCDRPPSAVVTLGDSITVGSSVSANHRWPDFLAERLRSSWSLPDIGVLNQGVSGNRLLHDPNPPAGHDAEDFAALFGEAGLKRFDRDVLRQPGVEYVVVALGVNDIGHPASGLVPESERITAEDLIDGYRQLIDRAHDRGLEIFGATIAPFRDTPLGFDTPENQSIRQAVNEWIRTSGEYDGVIDFDAALRDPAQPDRLLPAYDSGDHLHPNDAGNEAMAAAVPLRLFGS
ncbi:SGNH/GDSL hydrolase family protein [Streptomyces sp. B6B3]|uniref:SGNH/GDSL hydrolase family protein n=1 Tax=Streptomyces sp. B6B3 TaxID=3153570 RepID=UPI00325F844E